MKAQTQSIPNLPCLDEYSLFLTQMVAETSYLPDPGTVVALGGAVFPTVRNSKERVNTFKREGNVVGMYDDNTTPRWALLWAHGIVQTGHPKGWTFAHVWPSQDDLQSYTNLANLAMIPEAFGSLTDKEGPLTQFLQWHAWQTYQWKPVRVKPPQKPEGYDTLAWKYLPGVPDPRGAIRCYVASLNNQRIKNLRIITGKPEIL